MFNWHYPSVNPSPPPTAPLPLHPSPLRFVVRLCSWFFFVSFISLPFSSRLLFSLPPPKHLSPACSGVRPLYTNNRVPVLQRCPKEPLSPNRFKEAARRCPDRECEGAAGHGGGQYLTPRGVPGEKERPGGRKRQSTFASEDEDDQKDKMLHAEKRARIAAGEYHHHHFLKKFIIGNKLRCSMRHNKWPTSVLSKGHHSSHHAIPSPNSTEICVFKHTKNVMGQL